MVRKAERVRENERGYTLILAVAIIALLSALGLMVIDAAGDDIQLAGSDRGAGTALYLSEAGALWGKETVVNLVYPSGSSGNADATALQNYPTLAANDELCPDISCAGWYLLTSPAYTPYGTGYYKVAATCLPSCSATGVTTFAVRSLGKLAGSSQRLVEVTLGPP